MGARRCGSGAGQRKTGAVHEREDKAASVKGARRSRRVARLCLPRGSHVAGDVTKVQQVGACLRTPQKTLPHLRCPMLTPPFAGMLPRCSLQWLA